MRDEFEKTGNWLFRHRGVLPLLLFPLLAIAMRGYTYPSGSSRLNLLWEVACLLIGVTGLAIRAIAVGYAASGTSGRNRGTQIADSLNTTGMYSLLRHPLYLGNYFMWLAVAAFPRTWWLLLVSTLVFWLYYERIMFAEEAFLERKFGDEFRHWAAATPAFIPRLRGWKSPPRPFSLRTVVLREYSGFLALVLVFTALDFVAHVAHSGRLVPDPYWSSAATVALGVSAILRFLRRHTRVLQPAER